MPSRDGPGRGAYLLTVGDSSTWPVPGSGLVSVEQAAVAMMQRVLDAELQGATRVFSLVLGAVATRSAPTGTVSAEQVGTSPSQRCAAPPPARWSLARPG